MKQLFVRDQEICIRLDRYYRFSALFGIPMNPEASETIITSIKKTTIDAFHKRKIRTIINQLDRLAKRVLRHNEMQYFIEYVESHGFPGTKEQFNTGDKIDQWINKHIPNSRNKNAYKKAFKFILEQSGPKDCTYTHLLNVVRENIDPNIGDESLRKQIPKFIRDLPL